MQCGIRFESVVHDGGGSGSSSTRVVLTMRIEEKTSSRLNWIEEMLQMCLFKEGIPLETLKSAGRRI